LVKNTFENPSGRDLRDAPRELSAHVVRHRWLDGRQPARLLLDRRDEIGVLVAEVEVHQLAREVEERVPLVVPEARALAAGDGVRVDERLRAPGVEDVAAVVARTRAFASRSIDESVMSGPISGSGGSRG
jgi:hypothetical protein